MLRHPQTPILPTLILLRIRTRTRIRTPPIQVEVLIAGAVPPLVVVLALLLVDGKTTRRVPGGEAIVIVLLVDGIPLLDGAGTADDRLHVPCRGHARRLLDVVRTAVGEMLIRRRG